MAGKHEPASKRSFYFSLATWTLKRAALLVLAVVAGVLLLRAIQSEPTGVVASPRSPNKTPSVTPTKTRPTTQASPEVEGVVVLVLNGTAETGLAAKYTETLEEAGYTLLEPGNADPAETTTVFYHQGQEVNAEYLRKKQFRRALLEPAGAGFHPDADIVVVLGNDSVDAAP